MSLSYAFHQESARGITDLGTLPGHVDGTAFDINNFGTVAGTLSDHRREADEMFYLDLFAAKSRPTKKAATIMVTAWASVPVTDTGTDTGTKVSRRCQMT